jgi:hypothetical protein
MSAQKYRLKPGYAEKSSIRHPKEPETVIVVESDCAKAEFDGLKNLDGCEYCRFRVAEWKRSTKTNRTYRHVTFYFQLEISCRTN